jgi:glycosyltransferase involved in cell wall biosynthesis
MTLRVLTALVGDVQRKADMQAKYGFLFAALAQRIDVVENYDATLHGLKRYVNALQSFDLSKKRWKERFFRNAPAFRIRSAAITRHLSKIHPLVDVVLQLGVMFDSSWGGSPVPVVIYTDNTTAITARRPHAGRFAFSQRELADWLEHEKGCYQRAAHICVRSNVVKRSLLNDYGIAPEKISVVAGGVNYVPLPDVPLRDTTKAPTVLFIGQDFYRKGGDLVLEAFARARTQFPDARLLVVTGSAIPKGLPMEGVSHQQIGWNRQELANLYRQADVFILPSRQETWGDVLLEAMAFGLPCIGVTGEAMEDIILPNQTGFLAFPEDVDGLASSLEVLLGQPDLRLKMGLKSAEIVRQKFTWEIVADKLVPIMENAAKRNLS